MIVNTIFYNGIITPVRYKKAHDSIHGFLLLPLLTKEGKFLELFKQVLLPIR